MAFTLYSTVGKILSNEQAKALVDSNSKSEKRVGD